MAEEASVELVEAMRAPAKKIKTVHTLAEALYEADGASRCSWC
jgi:hypothetical protein